MSAVEEYEIHKGEMTLQEMHRADAAIAEMKAERDALRQGYEILATKLSEANAELVRLETRPRPD